MKSRFLITDEKRWLAWGPVRVKRVFGFNNNASDDRYIQFHEAPTVANNDVPAVPALYAPANAPFSWDFSEDPILLDELLVAISSTQVNYTAVTDTGLDMTVEFESPFHVTGNEAVAGDLTTGVAGLQVWSEATGASGGRRLLRVDFKNNNASARRFFISANDSISPADSSMVGPLVIAGSTTKRYGFGPGGIIPQELTSALAIKKGCTIYVSEDSVAPFTFTAATDFNIRAIYATV